jgi:hypothetical protein
MPITRQLVFPALDFPATMNLMNRFQANGVTHFFSTKAQTVTETYVLPYVASRRELRPDSKIREPGKYSPPIRPVMRLAGLPGLCHQRSDHIRTDLDS